MLHSCSFIYWICFCLTVFIEYIKVYHLITFCVVSNIPKICSLNLPSIRSEYSDSKPFVKLVLKSCGFQYVLLRNPMYVCEHVRKAVFPTKLVKGAYVPRTST